MQEVTGGKLRLRRNRYNHFALVYINVVEERSAVYTLGLQEEWRTKQGYTTRPYYTQATIFDL